MKKNMGKADKTLRIILGIIIGSIGIYYNSWWGAVSIIFIVTAFISWCPLYLPFGFSTISKQKES